MSLAFVTGFLSVQASKNDNAAENRCPPDEVASSLSTPFDPHTSSFTASDVQGELLNDLGYLDHRGGYNLLGYLRHVSPPLALYHISILIWLFQTDANFGPRRQERKPNHDWYTCLYHRREDQKFVT